MGIYSVTLLNEAGKKVSEQSFQYFDALRDLPAALQKAKSCDPNDAPSMYDKLKEMGEKLFKAILADKIGREVRRLVEVGGTVALRLRIGPDELKGVPWETIFDGSEFLVTSPGMVISRIPPGVSKPDKPVVETVPNLICIFMRPLLDEYGEETRWEKRKKSCQSTLAAITRAGEFKLTIEEVATLKEMHDVLAGDKHEIVHLFCQSEDNQVLVAEDELISAEALTKELAALRSVRLTVFSSVWGQNIAIVEMGRSLIVEKLSGVLVMPFEMGPAQERAFLETFYREVAKGHRLDYASSQARKACLTTGEQRSDFLLPVFFMTESRPFNPPELRQPEKSTLAGQLQELIEKEQGAKKALAQACLAYLQQQDGRYDAALESYNLAIPLFEESRDLYNLAVALNNVATIHIEHKEYEKALEPLRKCLELRKGLDAEDETAIAHSKLAYCSLKLKKLKESIENYRSALGINEQAHNLRGIYDSYFSLGVVHKAAGDLKGAVEMFGKSVETAREIQEDLSLADALEYLGVAYSDSEDFSRARETFNECAKLYDKMGDKAGQAVTLNNLGSVEQRLGNPDAAGKHHEEALEIFEKIGGKSGVASSLHNLAQVQKNQEQFPEAVSFALRAKDIAAKNSISDLERMSQALLEHIKNKIGRDKYAECLSKAEKNLPKHS